MNGVNGFDRYLVTPEQLSRLRREWETRLPLRKALSTLLISAFSGFALSFLVYLILAVVTAITGGDINTLFNRPGSTLAVGAVFCVGAMRTILRRNTGRVGCERPFFRETLIGAFAGCSACAAVVGLNSLFGIYSVSGLSISFHMFPWLLMLCALFVERFFEELLFRGLLMQCIARRGAAKGRKNAVLKAVLFSSLLFSLCNINTNASALFLSFLLGILFSLCFLWRGNLWGIAAFHALWSFTQGNVFGLGPRDVFGPSLLSTYCYNGILNSTPLRQWITAQTFGGLHGLSAAFILVLAIAFVWWRNMERIAKAPPVPPEGPPCPSGEPASGPDHQENLPLKGRKEQSL